MRVFDSFTLTSTLDAQSRTSNTTRDAHGFSVSRYTRCTQQYEQHDSRCTRIFCFSLSSMHIAVRAAPLTMHTNRMHTSSTHQLSMHMTVRKTPLTMHKLLAMSFILCYIFTKCKTDLNFVNFRMQLHDIHTPGSYATTLDAHGTTHDE